MADWAVASPASWKQSAIVPRNRPPRHRADPGWAGDTLSEASLHVIHLRNTVLQSFWLWVHFQNGNIPAHSATHRKDFLLSSCPGGFSFCWQATDKCLIAGSYQFTTGYAPLHEHHVGSCLFHISCHNDQQDGTSLQPTDKCLSLAAGKSGLWLCS